MKSFFAYDSRGRIVMTGECPASDLEYQQAPGATIAEGLAVIDAHYYDITTGRLVPLPPRPSQDHAFDYTRRRWVQDSALAETNVRAQRAREYPPLADQLDALWHAMQAGTLPMVPAFFDPIAAVKVKYPKPAGGKQ